MYSLRLTLLPLLLSLTLAGAADRPNIVLIVADDLGWSDLACYGNDLHETPGLDRLASEGIRFTDFYAASPVCTPTRAAILTGKHPARLRMTIWREAALERGSRPLLEPVCRDSLPLEETTLAEVLRKGGYYCAHVGKWHLGRGESYPEAHGFHENIGGSLWGAPQTFFYPYSGDGYFADWRYVPGLEPGKAGDYLTDALTDKALDILDREVAAGRRLFLNLWYHTVHTPIEGKPELVAKYEEKIGPGSTWKNPHYAAMVESLDQNVGRVLDRIEKLGVAENTIVLFTSDNGGYINRCKLHRDLQVADNTPLRSGKGSCYEGGIRVPLILRSPGGARGATCGEPLQATDFFPTLLKLVGLSEHGENPPDGVDFSNLLEDPTGTIGREDLYFHYPHYYPTTAPVSAIRSGDWKLLEYHGENAPVELYHLADDIGEARNLAEVNPEKRDLLIERLHSFLYRVEAQMPEPNPEK